MPRKSAPRSPFAPKSVARLPRVAGVAMAAYRSGDGYKGRDDFLVMRFAGGTKVAGLFTRNTLPAPSVAWCRKALRGGSARALLVNAGNANAAGGAAGEEAVRRFGGAGAAAFGCKTSEVFQASTGVIGRALKPAPYLPFLARTPENGKQDWQAAARAIMTTDTYPKLATASCVVRGVRVRINGIAKGAAMMAPDMATLLSFIVTDAALPRAVLQSALKQAAAESFHRITVDGDTSTNDTMLLFATGKAPSKGKGKKPLTKRDVANFRAALAAVSRSLARQVICDAEGITKLITIQVRGAATPAAAERVARAIAHSPLVKTAFAGRTPNWGRVIMAIGKAGERVHPTRLKLYLGKHLLAAKGGAVAVNARALATYIKGREITVRAELGVGAAKNASEILTSDLTHGYVSINTDYIS